jgi:hypothetical protein
VSASFFPDDTFDEGEWAEPPRTPWREPPRDELPALLPVSELIAATDSVALAITAIRVFSDGVEFVVDRFLRRNGRSAQDWQQTQAEFAGHQAGPRSRLRLGMVLRNGERLVVDPRRLENPDDPHSLTQTGGSGGGSGDHYQMTERLWLWPLPPDGPIELVLQWDTFGIPESRAIIDTTPAHNLASTIRPLWAPSAE